MSPLATQSSSAAAGRAGAIRAAMESSMQERRNLGMVWFLGSWFRVRRSPSDQLGERPRAVDGSTSTERKAVAALPKRKIPPANLRSEVP